MKLATTTPSFHHFSLLPFEIRTQIWIYALRVPLNHNILTKSHRFIPSTQTQREVHYCTLRSQPPSLLHVSSESRLLAERHYKRAFQHESHPRYTYINFSLDTIVMPQCDFKNLEYDEDRRAIQRLVITTEFSRPADRWEDCANPVMPCLWDMPHLKEFTIIYRKEPNHALHPLRLHGDRFRTMLLWFNGLRRPGEEGPCPEIRFEVEGETEDIELRDVKVLNRVVDIETIATSI